MRGPWSDSNIRRTAHALAAFLAAVCLLVGPAWAQPSAAGWGAYEIYQVRAGDTVENIAARFGVSPDLIRTINAVSDLQALAPGRALAVPIPGLPTAEDSDAPAGVTGRMLPPRYAVVKEKCQITSELGGGRLLFEVPPGTRLVVKVARGDYWGVVMVDGSIGWVEGEAVEVTDETIAPETLEAMLQGGRPDIVQEASRYLGTPYRYGGSLPYNLDCSLLVQTACAARGIRLPRTAAAQFEVGRSVSSSQLLPGDRLYFVSRSGRINHTGIYIGSGHFVHASARRGCVAVDSLADSVYARRFAGARRF